MSKARSLLKMTEDDMPETPPMDGAPDATADGPGVEDESDKPNSNFAQMPEVDEICKDIAIKISANVATMIGKEMTQNSRLKALIPDDDSEDFMFAYKEIALELAKMLRGEK